MELRRTVKGAMGNQDRNGTLVGVMERDSFGPDDWPKQQAKM